MITCRFEKHKYLVGIQYNSSDEDNGFFDIQRYATIKDLALEVNDYLENGKTSYPAFPAEAHPEILYVWDMDNPEDGDSYHDLMNELENIKKKEAIIV
jgi:hypothetical protein